MPKRKIKECLQFAKSKNGTVSHSHILNKFLWKCDSNHEWHSTLESVELGAWCPTCYFNDTNNLDPKFEYVKSPNKDFYFVYKTVNFINNKIYVGVHCTNKLNDNYLGSGKALKRSISKYGKDKFHREYVEFFDDAKSAYSREKQIVNRDFIKLTSNYNYAEGGGGGYIPKTEFSRMKLSKANKGLVTCMDKNGKIIKVKKELFDSNPDLIGHTAGMLMMRDKQGNICRVHNTDPRIKTGELVGSTAGVCVMKDKDGNTHSVFKDDPRITSGELVGVTKGSIQSAESNAKRRATQTGVPMPQPYYSCDVCKSKTSRINILRWHNDNCKFKGLPNPHEKAKQWEKLSQSQKNIKAKKYKETGILDL